MIPLPQNLTYNHYGYTQVLKGQRYCLYEQNGIANMRCYELFKIKVRPKKEINGLILEEKEMFPKNEDFGKSAWTICDYNEAIEKYNELESIQHDINIIVCWVVHPLILNISNNKHNNN